MRSKLRAQAMWASLTEEVRELRPALHLVQGLTGHLLPQFCFNRVRTALWRAAQIPIGAGSVVMGDMFLSGHGDWPSLFSIGKETYISGPLRINLGGAVRIGNQVNIGHDCMIVAVNHEIGAPWRRAGVSTNLSVVIEDGVWLASRVVVLPGTRIGRGAAVAAGAVVVSDVPPNTLVGGVPARVLRELG
jgi:maltose O-acetyltransferase